MKSKLITADMRAVVMERSQTKSTRFRPLLTPKYLGICDEIPLMLSGAKAESFYYVKYGSSIITSKILSKILSNENKKLLT